MYTRVIEMSPGDLRLLWFARTDIKAGQELTYNYRCVHYKQWVVFYAWGAAKQHIRGIFLFCVVQCPPLGGSMPSVGWFNALHCVP